MAVVVTSQPVDVPTGLRITTGKLDFNGTTYSAGGLAVTVAQWGGGVNGIPNRLPDAVLFLGGSASDDGDTDFATVLRYLPASGKVAIYGEEALTADSGLSEQDAEAAAATSLYVAFWFGFNPAGVTSA